MTFTLRGTLLGFKSDCKNDVLKTSKAFNRVFINFKANGIFPNPESTYLVGGRVAKQNTCVSFYGFNFLRGTKYRFIIIQSE